MAGRKKAILVVLFKVGVTVAMILWLVSVIDVRELGIYWKKADWRTLCIIAPIVFVICTWLNVRRWDLLLRQQGVKVGVWALIVMYTKGVFLGSLLPGGTTTGDVYRIYSLSKMSTAKAVSISSVVIDRAIASFSLLLVAIAGLYYAVVFTGNETFVGLVETLVLLATGLSLVVAIVVWMARKGFVERISVSNYFRSSLVGFLETIPRYFSRKADIGMVFLLCLCLHLTIISWIFAVSYAMNMLIPFHVLCMTVPVITLVTLLPMSVGGFGVREAAFVVFLGPFGVDASGAVSLAVISMVLQSALRVVAGAAVFLGVAPVGTMRMGGNVESIGR